jgi:hypothetical protein
VADRVEPPDQHYYFHNEEPQHPRGRVHGTLQLLQNRGSGEDEVQVCSNSRCEELCRAVIEGSDLLDASHARVAVLEAALRDVVEECTGMYDSPAWLDDVRAALAPCVGCSSPPCVCDQLKEVTK